jgi:hypothetical protein
MSRESLIQGLLLADGTITAITSTRIYISEVVGDNGLTSENASAIYNASGDILPTILVKERDEIFDDQVNNFDDKELSSLQIVELWVYEENGYSNINAILARSRKLLHGIQILNSFEIEFVLQTGPLRDTAALNGASMKRQDWSVPSVY